MYVSSDLVKSFIQCLASDVEHYYFLCSSIAKKIFSLVFLLYQISNPTFWCKRWYISPFRLLIKLTTLRLDFSFLMIISATHLIFNKCLLHLISYPKFWSRVNIFFWRSPSKLNQTLPLVFLWSNPMLILISLNPCCISSVISNFKSKSRCTSLISF